MLVFYIVAGWSSAIVSTLSQFMLCIVLRRSHRFGSLHFLHYSVYTNSPPSPSPLKRNLKFRLIINIDMQLERNGGEDERDIIGCLQFFCVDWSYSKCLFENCQFQPLCLAFIPSEARPKAEPVDRVTRSGIRTTKVKKKFWRPTMIKSDTFFYALKYAVKWPNFFFNLFALKSDPIFFSIFLH